MAEDSVPKSRVGPPVWVESLLTDAEHKELCQKWPQTCNRPMYKVADFSKHTKWRFGMGSTPSKEEMDKRNREIESLKQFHLSQQEVL